MSTNETNKEEPKVDPETPTETEIDKLNAEIEKDEVEKAKQLDDKVENKVKATMKDEKDKEEQLKSMEEITTKLNDMAKANEELVNKIEEQKKAIEDMPVQRKGIVSNESPVAPIEKKEPTQEEIIELLNENVLDAMTMEEALHRTLKPRRD